MHQQHEMPALGYWFSLSKFVDSARIGATRSVAMDSYIVALSASALVNGVAISRLWLIQIWRSFPILFSFISYQFVLNVGALLLSPYSHAYLRFYVVTEPVVSILAILIVREMYRQAFHDYPGLSSIARWATYVSAVAAVVLCALMLRITPAKKLTPTVVVNYNFLWEECVFFTVCSFILLMFFLLWRYPIQLDSNVIASLRILTPYFLLTSMCFALLSPEIVRSEAVEVVWSACCAGWAVLLRKPSSTAMVRVRSMDHSEETRLLNQLDAINNLLVRSVRR